MKTLRILGMTIVIIGLLVTFVYGGIEIFNLGKSIFEPAAAQIIDDVSASEASQTDSWMEHLRNITITASEASILFLGFKAGKDFIDEEEEHQMSLGK